jgi:hydroxyacylglutathione hydrolase
MKKSDSPAVTFYFLAPAPEGVRPGNGIPGVFCNFVENPLFPMISIQTFIFNALQENTYVLSDETQQAVIIDAGCYTSSEEKALQQYLTDNHLTVRALLSTHSHIDHVLGNAFVKKTFDVPLHVHELDAETLRSVPLYAPLYGFPAYQTSEPDGFLTPGSLFAFGNSALQILFVPGHAPGHIAFYHAGQNFIIGGDVLFRGSIGRMDLPGGDMKTLLHSIQTQFFTLPDETVVYPGHFATTTIGEEKKTNPFFV